ncbi:MAG: MalY/PatB family protein [Pseudomonadota bacterium]
MNKQTTPTLLDEVVNRREAPALKVHPSVLGEQNEDLFAAGVADMDFKIPSVILDHLGKRLAHGIFGYEAVPDDLFPVLTRWLAERHGWVVNERDILRAPNILNALAIAANLFSEEGDGVVVQPPVFFDFFDIIRENNRELITNPLSLENGHYRMDFADLENKTSDPRVKIIYLCNPHNPVGRVWGFDELKTLGDICQRNGVLVVSDEMHGDLVYSGHKYIPFASLGTDYSRNCITCLSPAKTFNIASCCCAFTVVADDAMRQAFQTENSRLTVNKNNAFSSVAMQAAYSYGSDWLDNVMNYLENNVALVKRYLHDISEVRLIEPEGTFLLWLDFRELNLPPDDLIEFLREKAKWAITRGHAFGEEGNGFVRLNIACTSKKLEDALQNLELAVKHLGE